MFNLVQQELMAPTAMDAAKVKVQQAKKIIMALVGLMLLFMFVSLKK